jgi:hypothetical protein
MTGKTRTGYRLPGAPESSSSAAIATPVIWSRTVTEGVEPPGRFRFPRPDRENDTGERDFHRREGDTFEFPGAARRATNDFEVYQWCGDGHVSQLSQE